MARTKYKHKFDTIVINNRWNQPLYSRSGNWVYFGVSTRFFSPLEYEITFHLFGIDVRIWFIRSVKKSQ